MTRTAGAPIGCQRPSRFWGLGCPKIYHEAEDTLGRRRFVASCFESLMQFLYPSLHSPSVAGFGLSVRPRCGFGSQAFVG
ncbi:hypothetical protein, partial [Thiolapillus sp.]|uniref:hypothetical protein n=1 Tax=Thiolapillus sp. TaxID=2017437 RepID=UPI003AF6CABD